MTEPLGRRAYDPAIAHPGDHDLLVELSRDLKHLISRVDEIRVGYASLDARVISLERRSERQDGALGVTRAALALAFSAGSLAVAALGLLAKLAGIVP